MCVRACTDTLTHKAGFEPLCTGMLMFSKETITQQGERQRDYQRGREEKKTNDKTGGKVENLRGSTNI